MAHNAGVMWEANIFILIMYTISLNRTARSDFVVYNERARDIDLDGSGVDDSLLQTGRAFAPTVLRGIDMVKGSHDDNGDVK